ncbi:MAG: hypothetical protein Q8P67_15545, partial [archaeon]|nr:hypothetical protein [archaeon]
MSYLSALVDKKILLKCYMGNDIRILSLPSEPSPEELRSYFAKPEVFGEPVTIDRYEDHEGRQVSVRDDLAVLGAFRQYYSQKQHGQGRIYILKLFLRPLHPHYSPNLL